MDRLQGHNNLCFLDRKVNVSSLEATFKEEEDEENFQESVPFLQMLQSEESEPSFLKLLSLQNLKEPWELQSYHLPETNCFYQNLISATSKEGTNQDLLSKKLPIQENMLIPCSSSSPRTANSRRKRKISDLVAPEMTREKRKRRKTKQTKNIEEIENQRVNHIAVERNRRRQMNEHINSLRTLLPPSYIQRGDQASIVGGTINYVKVLEQIIQSLESQKRTQQSNGVNNQETNNQLLSGISSNDMWTTQEDQTYIPKIETTVIQEHVNLKVQCQKKQGQLLKGIISLEKLRFTVLHLNIVSLSHSAVSYSFNLKMEDDCDLETADEITKAAHQIFDIRRFD